jgi:hypothetical protein
MLGYNALSGLSEIDLSKFRVANVKLPISLERAVYINDGCSPSKKEYNHRGISS